MEFTPIILTAKPTLSSRVLIKEIIHMHDNTWNYWDFPTNWKYAVLKRDGHKHVLHCISETGPRLQIDISSCSNILCQCSLPATFPNLQLLLLHFNVYQVGTRLNEQVCKHIIGTCCIFNSLPTADIKNKKAKLYFSSTLKVDGILHVWVL